MQELPRQESKIEEMNNRKFIYLVDISIQHQKRQPQAWNKTLEGLSKSTPNEREKEKERKKKNPINRGLHMIDPL